MPPGTAATKPDLPLPGIMAIVPWYGSNRMRGHVVGQLLRGCKWVGVPFAGSMTELLHLDASTIIVGDAHAQLINLARVIADPRKGPAFYRIVRRAVLCDRTLHAAQERCKMREPGHAGTLFSAAEADVNAPALPVDVDVQWAVDYWICCWMGRSNLAGTQAELDGNVSVRWSASGGDSAVRYQSAVKSLTAWRRVFRGRTTFVVKDFEDFLGCVDDQPGHGLYCDPPWVGDGDLYKHRFTEKQHQRLAYLLAKFKHVRIVVRYGQHPLIEGLYPPGRGWRWQKFETRSQANQSVPEALIVRERG